MVAQGVLFRVGFNPHSSFRTSATSPSKSPPRTWAVSILTRAFARVQRPLSLWPPWPPWRFQSSLELSHECNAASGARRTSLNLFQSSLELSHECNFQHGVGRRNSQAGFNPHSSFRTSATGEGMKFVNLTPVSILTRAFARVQQQGDGWVVTQSSVSILTRAFARVQPPVATAEPVAEPVSILTRAFARVQRPPRTTRSS